MRRHTLVGLALLGVGAFLGADEARAALPQEAAVSVRAPSPGWLGLTVSELSDKGDRIHFLITDILDGSPAERAGLRAGDHIVRVNGADVSMGRLRSMTARLAPGDPMAFQIRRGDETMDFTVVAGLRPGRVAIVPERLQAELDAVRGRLVEILKDGELQATVSVVAAAPSTPGSPEAPAVALASASGMRLVAPTIVVESVGNDSIRTRVVMAPEAPETPEVAFVPREMEERRRVLELRALERSRARAEEPTEPMRPLAPFMVGLDRVGGAALRPITPELGRYFGVEEGLLVTSVDEDAPAHRAGLRSGDVVVAANGTPVSDLQELRAVLAAWRGGHRLEVVRKGERIGVELR